MSRWRRRPVSFTVGAHNLHDDAGVPTFFADVLLFTEAIPATVRARRRQRIKHAAANVIGYRVVECPAQDDLVIAFRRRLFKLHHSEYRLAHKGIANVTPHRGTFTLYGEIRATGQLLAIKVEHRINSWWKNERGEQAKRFDLWHQHQFLTVEWIAEDETAGYLVLAGGDENAPPRVLAFAGELAEVSTSLDRLGASHRAGWSRFARLTREGSDHYRIRALLTLPKKKETHR